MPSNLLHPLQVFQLDHFPAHCHTRCATAPTTFHCLLDTMEAQHVVISFPTRSIGGRDVGMISHYTRYMEALLAQQPRPRRIRTFQLKRESVFILSNAS